MTNNRRISLAQLNTMLRGKIAVGNRVTTLRDKYEPMIGINVPAGVTGEIVNIEPLPQMGGTLIEIRLDDLHADLVDFDNVLQFVTEGDETLGDYVFSI